MQIKTLALGLLASASLAFPAVSEGHKPAFGGNFTFKKIKPPSGSVKKRITIQIEPKPVVAAKPKPQSDKSKGSNSLDWFWDAVSPSVSASGPGRFTQAVDSLENAPSGKGLAEPRLDTLQSIAQAYGSTILMETIDKKISPAFVLALISVESSGRTNAESNKGAQGLMQLIPDTAKRFGVTDSTDPVQNIKGGVAYLAWLMKEFNGDPILALAGYNAGENAVKKHKGVPPYAETRAYVPKVLTAWRVARRMCLTPPELVSDGCVFRTSG